MAYKLNVDGEDKYLFGLFEEKDKTIKCENCGDLYKAEGQTFIWEMNDRFKGLCQHCYLQKLNDNFTEEDALEFAKEALSNRDYMGRPRVNSDVNDENWEKYVEPKIEELIEAKKKAEEEAYHQEKLNEAQKLYDAASLGVITNDAIIINVIAALLEKIDKLENNQSNRRLTDELFCR